MTYYTVALYFKNGVFYHTPPGNKVWCFMDDKGRYYYENKNIAVRNNPEWDGRLFREHSIRPWPGKMPEQNSKFEDIHGLIQNKL